MTSIKQIIHIYSNIVPNPKTLIASLCIGISFATAAGTYETQSDIMISGVDYTYESSPNSNGTPSFRGQLSFSISFSDSPDYIVIGKTTAEYAESEITATGFDGRNVGSAYMTHTLSLSSVSQSAAIEYDWEMFLKNENGLFSLCSTGSNANFTIPKFDAPDSYQINSDKELEAIIRCTYKRNDTTYVTPFFHCYLDLKPRILSIEDITITNKPDYIYSVSFYVRYCGSDHVHVEADNENSSYVERFDFYQPEYAHVEVPRMDEFVANWIIVSVQNEFGTATERLDFPATYDPYASTIRNESVAQQPISAQIYKVDGTLVYSGEDSATTIQHLSSGIFIITYRYADGRIKTDKIIIQ